jgi:hypothetical protein
VVNSCRSALWWTPISLPLVRTGATVGSIRRSNRERALGAAFLLACAAACLAPTASSRSAGAERAGVPVSPPRNARSGPPPRARPASALAPAFPCKCGSRPPLGPDERKSSKAVVSCRQDRFSLPSGRSSHDPVRSDFPRASRTSDVGGRQSTELGRVIGHRRALEDLIETERRVAALAARGAQASRSPPAVHEHARGRSAPVPHLSQAWGELALRAGWAGWPKGANEIAEAWDHVAERARPGDCPRVPFAVALPRGRYG